MTRHQFRISVLVSKSSFREGTSGARRRENVDSLLTLIEWLLYSVYIQGNYFHLEKNASQTTAFSETTCFGLSITLF